MPPEKKRIRLSREDELSDLILFRNQIKQINSMPETEAEIKREDAANFIETYDDPLDEGLLDETEDQSDIKRYIREQILQSEKRIMNKIVECMKNIEKKIQRANEKRYDPENLDSIIIEQETEDEEQHLIEYEVPDQIISPDELSNNIFPISDENTFDWFMSRLADDEYRNALVNNRWQLARHINTRSFNVTIKNFIRLHFELAVCIKYSVSGYGTRGTKKKKFDAQSLAKYIFDCLNRMFPGAHTFQEISKGITYFWGRAQDMYIKSNERTRKDDSYNTVLIKESL